MSKNKHTLALKSFLIRAGLIVGSGGFIFGYDIGVISGTLGTIKDDFNLTIYEVSTIVSVLYAGSIVGCIFGGPLCDHYGRWKTIQIQNIVFVLGAIVTASAQDITMLVFGRFLVGIASALSGLADVPYLTEVASAEYRGLLSGQYEILVAGGILVSFTLDLAFSVVPEGWRYALLIPGVLAGLQSLAMCWLPESPKWLLGKGRDKEARQALLGIYGTELMDEAESSWRDGGEAGTNASAGYGSHGNHSTNSDHMGLHSTEGYPEDLQAYLTARTVLSSPSSPSSVSDAAQVSKWDWMLGNDSERSTLAEYNYSLMVILALQTFSQISGANVVRNYAPTIFEDSGSSDFVALLVNIALGIVKFVTTIWSVYTIESEGRLHLLTVGIVAVTLGMIMLVAGTQTLPLFIIGCVFIYAGFGLGYGPVPWVMSAEVIPTNIRARVVSHSLVASNLAQLVTNFAFLPMVKGLSAPGCFGVFLFLNLLSLAYTRLFVVETRSLQPNEILQQLLEKYESSMVWLNCEKRPWCPVQQAEVEASQEMEVSNPIAASRDNKAI